MCRRIIFAGVFAPLLLLGCQADQSSDAVQVDETLNLSRDEVDNADILPEIVDTGSNSEPLDNVAYIETFLAEGQRKLSSSTNTSAMADFQQSLLRYAFSDYVSHASTELNFVSAPFDQQQLLAIIALGADGTSLQALSKAGNLELADMEVQLAFNDKDQQLDALGSVERQGFLWGQERYKFSHQYLQNQDELYGPQMNGLDFQAASALAQTTVSEALGGQLELTEIDDRSRLVAAQTSQLDAAWSAELKVEPARGRFAVLKNDEQRWVDMVRIDGMMNVIEADDYRAVEIPLVDSELSLLLITPALGEFDNLRSRFDQTFLQEQLEKLAPAQTTAMVPLFEIDRKLTKNEMPDLGVALLGPEAPKVVFDENGVPQWVLNDEGVYEVLVVEAEVDPDAVANFSGVNDAGYLYLLPPRQRIAFNLGETGVNSLTASAVVHEATENEPSWLFNNPSQSGYAGFSMFSSDNTTLWPSEKSCFYPPDQRPFLFAVYSRQSQTLLHLGHVVELSGAKVDPDWMVSSYSDCGDSPPPVQIYQYSESLQCDVESGVSLADMNANLINAGIDVLESSEGHDGLFRIQLCGSETGEINIFTISAVDVPLAESLGFYRLSLLSLW